MLTIRSPDKMISSRPVAVIAASSLSNGPEPWWPGAAGASWPAMAAAPLM
ncbi:MAG TPA: hypothetical protein VIX86_16240 [Streptosporangiaceae bacterium]